MAVNNTIFSVYNRIKDELKSSGIEDYGFEARQIIRHITGFDNKKILANYNLELNDYQLRELKNIVCKRQTRYPLQYILGEWSFYGRTFKVGEGVLIPRVDTEVVVEKAIELAENKKAPLVLDLCSGSGAIGITLALEIENSTVYMLEKYDEALEFSTQNVSNNKAVNAKVIKGDVLKGDLSDKKFDLIVSNPPYVSAVDMKKLQQEVTFEPESALCPGEDELLFYKEIAKRYKSSINPGGAICFEVGINQAERIEKILTSSGFYPVGTAKDYNGIERVVFGTVD